MPRESLHKIVPSNCVFLREPIARLCTEDGSDIDGGVLRELKENPRRRTRADWPALGLSSQERVAGISGRIQTIFDARCPDVERRERTPVIRVRINAKLVKMPRREIVASQTFEGKIKAERYSMKAIIGAFDRSIRKALQPIVVGTLKTGETHRPGRLHSKSKS